uniref:Lysozyme g n=1 Tax=Hucho hucho TaxID=62062 RepID=A0A4W5P1S0_9TELE
MGRVWLLISTFLAYSWARPKPCHTYIHLIIQFHRKARQHLMKWPSVICPTWTSTRYGVDPAVLGGIISRESRGGTGPVNGSGDNGNSHELMQVDKCCHSPKGTWDSQEHIDQGKKYPHWTKEQKLKGALAAYNMGAGSISSYEQVDAKTTGGDYANDVAARAQYFKKHGY